MEEKQLEEGKELELRMYFFVPYNISPIQQGIQAGHSLGRYCLRYGRYDPNHIVWDFLEKFQTWIILNGGTTNADRDFESIPVGSINLIADQLEDNDIDFSFFIEPDLNNALTALSIICDERVFNRKDYPIFVKYMTLNHNEKFEATIRETDHLMEYDEIKDKFPEEYKEWVRFIGGVKNVFLLELIKDKKLA